MSLSIDTVKYVAELSRLDLEPAELEVLARQLTAVLDFIDQLKDTDTASVSPTSHILPISNVFRDDKPGICLPIEKTLANAPQKEGNFFSVPKVIE